MLPIFRHPEGFRLDTNKKKKFVSLDYSCSKRLPCVNALYKSLK